MLHASRLFNHRGTSPMRNMRKTRSEEKTSATLHGCESNRRSHNMASSTIATSDITATAAKSIRHFRNRSRSTVAMSMPPK